MANAELVFVFVAVALFLIMGLRVVPENRRVAVTRLGRYSGMRGPGLVFTLPFVDRCTVVRLDTEIPGWQSMSPERLNETVRQRIAGQVE